LSDILYNGGQPITIKKDKKGENMAEIASQEEQQGGSSNKLLILVAVMLLIVLIIGAVLAYSMLNSDDEIVDAANQATKSKIVNKSSTKSSKDQKRGTDYTQIGPMYSLDKFIVNLFSDSGGRYLRAAVNLELSSAEFQPEVDKKQPLIRDIIIKTLSAKSYEEISTIRGKEVLKDEIVVELNGIFTDGTVENIFFTEFVVQ
jgi:flagellar FliL protein